MTTLHEQIEALPLQGESVMSQRAAILDIIDQHECYQQGLTDASEAAADAWAEHVCIPDRDALARALDRPEFGYRTDWADAIIAALEKPWGGHSQLPIGPDEIRDGWSEPAPQAKMVKLSRELLEKALEIEMEDSDHGNDD